jgi:hypothetical protein
MATAGPVFQVAVFDPAATHIMGQAFDCACRSLHDIGQLDNTVREVIAKRIVELARDGERDPNKLCEHSLLTLGFFSRSGRSAEMDERSRSRSVDTEGKGPTVIENPGNRPSIDRGWVRYS